jgi:hypothetical protein
MARKKLSTQGRVAAAGVTIAVAGVLGGLMAAGDHTAHATSPASGSSSPSADTGGTSYVPSDGGATAFPNGQGGSGDTSGQFQPQPQTRTGGS